MTPIEELLALTEKMHREALEQANILRIAAREIDDDRRAAYVAGWLAGAEAMQKLAVAEALNDAVDVAFSVMEFSGRETQTGRAIAKAIEDLSDAGREAREALLERGLPEMDKP